MITHQPLILAFVTYLIISIPDVFGECSDDTVTAAGYYQNASGKCEVCPIGWKCPSGTSTKTICAAGTVQPMVKQTYCIECSINTYNTQVGQSQCTNCPSRWATGVGSDNCNMTCNSDSYLTDGQCLPMEMCDLTTQHYEYLTSGNRVCRNITYCDTQRIPKTTCSKQGKRVCQFRQNYITVRATETSDRTCTPYSQCEVNEYMYGEYVTDHVGVVIRNQTCRKFTSCGEGRYHIINGTTREDRDNVCGMFTVCNIEIEYQVSAPDLYNDRVCAAMTICDPVRQYIHRKGGAYSDNVCGERTRCSESAFELTSFIDSTSVDTIGTDTQCQNYSTCALG